MATQRLRGVDSARRALQILLHFSEETPEIRVEDLPGKYGISSASAYRYISLLREMSLIEERQKGTFVPSLRVLKLARAAEQTLNYQRDIQPALSHLTDQIDETSLYLRRTNHSAVCVAIAKTDHAISISFELGHVMPLHRGAGAKVLLSDYTIDEQKRYINRCYPAFTADEALDLMKELERIRVDNFSESYGEVDHGVWACASPVFFEGRMMGVVSIVAPEYRVNSKQRENISQLMRETVSAIENNLGRSAEPVNIGGALNC